MMLTKDLTKKKLGDGRQILLEERNLRRKRGELFINHRGLCQAKEVILISTQISDRRLQNVTADSFQRDYQDNPRVNTSLRFL